VHLHEYFGGAHMQSNTGGRDRKKKVGECTAVAAMCVNQF